MKTDNMSVIPPVEERQYRKCDCCVFSWEDDYLDLNCNLHVYPRKDLLRDTDPCIYHYTDDEMNELLDNLEK